MGSSRDESMRRTFELWVAIVIEYRKVNARCERDTEFRIATRVWE